MKLNRTNRTLCKIPGPLNASSGGLLHSKTSTSWRKLLNLVSQIGDAAISLSLLRNSDGTMPPHWAVCVQVNSNAFVSKLHAAFPLPQVNENTPSNFMPLKFSEQAASSRSLFSAEIACLGWGNAPYDITTFAFHGSDTFEASNETFIVNIATPLCV